MNRFATLELILSVSCKSGKEISSERPTVKEDPTNPGPQSAELNTESAISTKKEPKSIQSLAPDCSDLKKRTTRGQCWVSVTRCPQKELDAIRNEFSSRNGPDWKVYGSGINPYTGVVEKAEVRSLRDPLKNRHDLA